MSVWRWPSARWGVTVLTVHQGERADRATLLVVPLLVIINVLGVVGMDISTAVWERTV